MKKLCLLFALLFSSQGFAQAKFSPLKKADVLSVKSTLENMIVRRYTQELSSIVEPKHFNIGASFNLKVISTEKKPQNLSYNDLELGYLDADALFDSYSIPNMAGANPFEKYSIRGVEIQMGLNPEVGDKIKASVEEWLAARVKQEFGKAGKTVVNYRLDPDAGKSINWLKKVQDMQGLVGNIVIAVTILLGIILFQLLGGGKTTEAEAANSSQSISINSKTEMAEGAAPGSAAANIHDAMSEESTYEQIAHVKVQIKDLAPKVMDQLESLIETWCEHGEEGLNTLACFAETTGSILGTLPIPKEEKKKMSAIFAKMHEISADKKLEYFNKIYWDLISTLNLGTESLNQPFSFIGNSALGTINNVLLGNDIETQTVVSLFMPDKMRKKYFESLDEDKRIELLNSAAQLSAITEDSLKDIEEHIAPYFGESETEASSVSMELTLNKLVEAMSFSDACRLLPSIEGPVMNKFKLKNAHIGFLSVWDRSAVAVIAKYSSNEAMLAYVRVMPDMKHHILEFVPPRTKQILEDDLDQVDTMSPERKEELLGSLHKLVLSLVDNGELSLEDIVQVADNDTNEKLDIAA